MESLTAEVMLSIQEIIAAVTDERGLCEDPLE